MNISWNKACNSWTILYIPLCISLCKKLYNIWIFTVSRLLMKYNSDVTLNISIAPLTYYQQLCVFKCLINPLFNHIYFLAHTIIIKLFLFDFCACMNNCGMITPSKFCADFRERIFYLFAEKKHGDLARADYFFSSAAFHEVSRRNAVKISN